MVKNLKNHGVGMCCNVSLMYHACVGYACETGPGFQTDFQFPFSSKERNKKIIAHLCANPLVFVPTLDPNNVQVNAPNTPVHEKTTRVQTFFIDKACSTLNNQAQRQNNRTLKTCYFLIQHQFKAMS